MEIEAKFSVSDPTTLNQLLELDHLGNYAISPGTTQQVKDSYLDTADREILAAGYALRRRESGGGQSVMTLKGLGGVDGPVHRREELEVALPPTPEARQIWLSSPLYARLYKITGEDVLGMLFALTQQRTANLILLDDRPIAELSFDEARYLIDDHTETYYEVEIELAETGTEADLEQLIDSLQTQCDLSPQPLSKFERGLAILDGPAEQPEPELVPEPETTEVEMPEEPEPEMESEIAPAEAEVEPETRLVSLPEEALELEVEAESVPEEVIADLADLDLETPILEEEEEEEEEPEVETKAEPEETVVAPPEKLTKPPVTEEVSQPDESEPSGEITEAELAILTRIADTEKELYSRRAIALLALNKNASTREAGEIAGLSARQVRHWRNAFQEKREQIFPNRILARATTAPKLSQLRLDLDDSMAEAARKILQYQLQRMIFHESGTRLGLDIEELHDMRVATRRMRAALRVFANHLDPKALHPYKKGLQKTGRTLGSVRDLDVFEENMQQFLDDRTEEAEAIDLLPLQKYLDNLRTKARQTLVGHFDSKSYQKFKRKFAEFLREPGAGALPIDDNVRKSHPHRLRHVIPIILYQRWAAVRAYDELVAQPDVPLETLHRLRIDCKRLRYTLEFFQSVLGTNAIKAIDTLKVMQDHLGALQDTVVAEAMILDFLSQKYQPHDDATPSPDLSDVSGTETYLAARQAEQISLLETFSQAWENFHNAGINQWLAAIARKL